MPWRRRHGLAGANRNRTLIFVFETICCRSALVRALWPQLTAVTTPVRLSMCVELQIPHGRRTVLLLCCCETHNARALHRTPSTGAAIAMDGGVADTACYYTGRVVGCHPVYIHT